MKYCIIGSGGREHALCSSLKNSNNISKIYCIPGNAGTSSIAENKSIDLKDFEQIKDFIKKNEKIEVITLRLNKILEEMILKNPDQWIWTHNRWK